MDGMYETLRLWYYVTRINVHISYIIILCMLHIICTSHNINALVHYTLITGPAAGGGNPQPPPPPATSSSAS